MNHTSTITPQIIPLFDIDHLGRYLRTNLTIHDPFDAPGMLRIMDGGVRIAKQPAPKPDLAKLLRFVGSPEAKR